MALKLPLPQEVPQSNVLTANMIFGQTSVRQHSPFANRLLVWIGVHWSKPLGITGFQDFKSLNLVLELEHKSPPGAPFPFILPWFLSCPDSGRLAKGEKRIREQSKFQGAESPASFT